MQAAYHVSGDILVNYCQEGFQFEQAFYGQ